MTGKRRWLSLLLVAALATVGVSIAASADSGTEAEFIAKINASRASAGLAPLSADGSLTSYAREHTQFMMDGNCSGGETICHSSSGQLGAAGGSGWDKMGENVGRGQSASSLHEAFMNSSGHKANILGDYNYVGVGTGSKDGYLFVTVIFMKKGSTSTPTTAAETPGTTEGSSPTTTKAAPDNTTTTTIATTTTTIAPTTTTMIVGPDKAVVPGQACLEAGRFGQLCHN